MQPTRRKGRKQPRGRGSILRRGAKGRKHALSLASGESAREDIEDAGAGGDGEQRRSCEEESQEMSVQQLTIVAVGSTGIEAGYETPMAHSFQRTITVQCAE
jgi:hypothetical protein